MKLISDIINDLVDSERTLTGPFLKTKVFASKIENDILLDWINLELKGYHDNRDLPSYRKFDCLLVGDWINGTGFRYMQGKNMQLPISGYGDEWQDYFTTFWFRQSISTLENFLLSDNEQRQLIEPLPPDISEIIARKIRANGNPYFSLTSASKRISLNSVTEILSTLRSNLLDFMIKIDKEFGYVTDINQLTKEDNLSNQITNIMSQTIIHNQGDSNIVNTGNNNTNTINFEKGNFDGVEKIFKESGISENDINQLKKVIDLEKSSVEEKTFGTKVNAWIKKMLAKSLDGTWKISIGVAAKLLSDVIAHYYGH